MHQSKLETDGKRKFLTCFYDRRLKDWDQVIQAALLKHNLKAGQCTVLCKPLKGETNGRRNENNNRADETA